MGNDNRLHLVDKTGEVAGKTKPTRLKAKHFSPFQREIITELLDTHMSCEDVARQLSQRGGFKGITPQAVQDVAIIYLLRKPPVREQRMWLVGDKDRRRFA